MAIKKKIRPMIYHLYAEKPTFFEQYYFSMEPPESLLNNPTVDSGHQETFYFQTDDEFVTVEVRKNVNAFENWFNNLGVDHENKMQYHTSNSHKKTLKGAIWQIHYNFRDDWRVSWVDDPALLKQYVDELVQQWEAE